MEYRDLGKKTGIRVSAIGFGGWAIGGASEASGAPLGWGRQSDEESLAAIRRARELGITFFDTADSYGFGRSESLLGIVLSRYRPDVVIATKVGDIPEIIEHRRNGVLIEPGDSKALAAAILEFISDPKLATNCSANGLRYANEHFSFDRMMEAKLQVDASLIRPAKTKSLTSSAETGPVSEVTTADLASRER